MKKEQINTVRKKKTYLDYPVNAFSATVSFVLGSEFIILYAMQQNVKLEHNEIPSMHEIMNGSFQMKNNYRK